MTKTTMGGGAATYAKELALTIRGLLRRPGYTILAVSTLALGVGAVTAAYGLLHQVVLRPLPFADADRLVAIRTLYDSDVLGVTPPEYMELLARADVFERLAVLVEPHLDEDWTWSVEDERRPLAAVRVSGAFFDALGVTPEIGTLSVDADAGAPHVVVSHAFWRGALGGDPAVVGTTLRINAERRVVAGVLPPSFEFPLGAEPTDAWILFTPEPGEAYADMPLSYRVVGRLPPGVGVDEAAAQVTRVIASYRATLSDDPGRTLVRPITEDLLGSARQPLILLTFAGVLVLLVASLNLSLLIAARNVERRHELSVRVALGASRGRLVRHLISEAGVLATLGGAVALVAAALVMDELLDAPAWNAGRLAAAVIGGEVVLLGLAAALVPALLAAALPALRVITAVQGFGSRGGSTDRGGRRFAWTVSAVESGLVFALLVIAALVLRSLDEVTAVDPGFDATSTLALTIFIPPEEYAGEAGANLMLSMEERLEAVPGVRAVGAVTNLPLSPESWSGSLRIEGRDDVGGERAEVVDWELVSPGYFDAIGIPLVRGRAFDERDRPGADRAVIINETLARRWWPGGDALGARLGGGGPLRTVVGIVGDVKQQGLHTATRGFMYLPTLQTGAAPKQEIVVRVTGDDPLAAMPQVRAALLELEPDLALGPVRTLGEVVRTSSGAFRLRAVLLGAFATMALLLGMAGIYGVTAHGVRTRRGDIGIRLAMGADGGQIMRDVVAGALFPVFLGLLGGLLIVLVTAPALQGILFGVAPTDPTALLAIGALLMASGAAAVAPSALRARQVDPAGLLRRE